MEIDEDNLVACAFGSESSKCHLTTLIPNKGIKLLNEYKLEDQQLISRRSGLTFDETSLICLHHQALLLTKYDMLQKSCCNPFGKKNHMPSARKNLRPITLEIADHMKDQMKIDVSNKCFICTFAKFRITMFYLNTACSLTVNYAKFVVAPLALEMQYIPEA